MKRIVDLPPLINLLRLAALLIGVVLLSSCAVLKGVQDKYLSRPSEITTEQKKAPPEKIIQQKEIPLVETIESHAFPILKGDDVVGRSAYIRLVRGDTLPDIARHFGLGLNGVSAANPGVDVWVPEAGSRILLPLSFLLPDAPRKGIVINLAAMRLFQYAGEGEASSVFTCPIGIGTEERPTPMGQMYVKRKATKPTWNVPASIAEDHRKKGDPLPKKVLPGPDNPLGEYALYLSKDTYLIHGTNKPASIGLRATNGCIRLYPENIERLYANTPVKTPVNIVYQPYLIGRCNGVLYMEAHAPFEDMKSSELEKIYAKLKKIEKELGGQFDWERIRKIVAEARGIPVPLLEVSQGSGKASLEEIEVRHPDKLFGRPEVPALDTKAWYVSAASLNNEVDAARLAAIINHQGPPIPARVLPKSNSYSVIAGPFSNIKEAKAAAKRLKIDLEINGILVEPAETK
jgi:L,D-transpeptidase ErfK/SrfK